LESAFEGLKVSYTTGYRKRKDKLALWAPPEFEKRSHDVRIFKLHGSINWGQFYYYPPPPIGSKPSSDAIATAELYIWAAAGLVDTHLR
jgi:hypothetical protein